MQCNILLRLLDEPMLSIRPDVACILNLAYVLFVTCQMTWITVRLSRWLHASHFV